MKATKGNERATFRGKSGSWVVWSPEVPVDGKYHFFYSDRKEAERKRDEVLDRANDVRFFFLSGGEVYHPTTGKKGTFAGLRRPYRGAALDEARRAS